MSQSPPPIAPSHIFPDDPAYRDILTWPFPESPFYATQVKRVLESDIPQRFQRGECFSWIYRDSQQNPVGFGTLALSNEYSIFTDGIDHTYIPVLAVHPHSQGRGYGKQIVDHLVAEAALIYRSPCGLSDKLFLDVYTANTAAIRLYQSKGFIILNPNTPLRDSGENDEPYVVMARSVAIDATR